MNERKKLAKLLFMADNFNAVDPEHEWKVVCSLPLSFTDNYYRLADAVIAGGYKRDGTA